MNKRIIALITATALTVSFAACSKDDDSDDTTRREPDSQEDTTDETDGSADITDDEIDDRPVVSEQALTPPEDADEQVEAMVAAIDTWYMEMDGVYYQYAITDFDCDGRLELICASVQGSGYYTYADFYEVNADNGGITPLSNNLGEGYDFPDIITPTTQYYDMGGVRHYMFYNNAYSGAMESYCSYDFLSIQDNVVTIDSIGYVRFSTDEAGNDQILFYDPDGNEISQSEFDHALETINGDFDWQDQNLYWVQFDQGSAGVSLHSSLEHYYAPPITAEG